jgi:hypothetical protein
MKEGGNSIFKMLLPTYQTAWRHSPEDSNLDGHTKFSLLLRSVLRVQSSQNVNEYNIYYFIKITFYIYIRSIKLRLSRPSRIAHCLLLSGYTECQKVAPTDVTMGFLHQH